ncbi:MAG: DUF86 domain-containing protein [Candidatus Hydrothermarchaeota archaeon]|nr:MAG: DUF86 domain-containing protein [Candidatus Hydrothermarchaeota archaeon]
MKREILSKIDMLKKYVDLLKNYKYASVKDLEKDPTLRGAVERYLQVAIECCLDIGEMIISVKGFKKPESYREVIEILGKEGVLPKEFANKFAPAASFRNILVHAYAEVDVEKLYEFLQENVEDFEIFAKYIAEYLENI